jgi:hypothetical protein
VRRIEGEDGLEMRPCLGHATGPLGTRGGIKMILDRTACLHRVIAASARES